MSAKHTPGPWSVFIGGRKRDIISVCIGNDANGVRPCIVDTGGFDGCDLPIKIQHANARLIAASPELLEALEALEDVAATEANARRSCSGDLTARLSDARAAIAKVKGEA